IHDDLTRTVDLCRKAEATGVSWITVHGRTAEERHQPVHYEAIKIIKENMSIPVIANGDIRNLKEAKNVWHITGTDGVMVARGLLANPAMFAGYEETPLKCIWDWVDIALELGTPYMCFHQHLMYMMEKITSRQEKRIFNALSSTSAVLDYLTDHYGIQNNVFSFSLIDAVREVRKYSSTPAIEKGLTSRPGAYEHAQMKLFRSQRNLYISGFSLFFWLVLRRLVILITQLAKELSNKGVLKTQAENTNEAAKKFMEENERLKRLLKSYAKEEEHILEAENKKLVEDQEKLKTELKKTSDALSKAQNDVMTMRMQSEHLSKEYDRLLKEHAELQVLKLLTSPWPDENYSRACFKIRHELFRERQ
ncbi:B-cell receptor-associated protein 31, partial [Leptonychotes weddellii]|uniref:B-cell receptor-associated protein 31 n=1 Tax=Leptonychotes weddellii TaxID=9713 RepID=A0A7F8RX41_LEPWE